MAKSYGEFCSVAHALDVVGDRWALLVVRELMLGPSRYTDLLSALPGVGTNVLATRLRELEAGGVVEREQHPAPTPATLYRLTDDGEDLRDVVTALAHWGMRRLTRPAPGEAVEARWLALAIAAEIRSADIAGLDDGDAVQLDIADESYALTVDRGRLVARRGPAADPTTTLAGSIGDLFATLKGDARARNRITVTGHTPTARKLLATLS